MTRGTDQRGDIVKQGQTTGLPGVEALALRVLGVAEDGVGLDLTALLCRLLVRGDRDGKTWAQWMIEGWIVNALEGNLRALEGIIDRTEKARSSGSSAAHTPSPIDEKTAGKILEVLCGSGDVATSA